MIKTDWKDDIFEGNRKYQMITNDDGTVSFVDVTEYTQEGDAFGAAELKEIAEALNDKTAEKLETARSITTDLASEEAAFDGSEDVTPGVSGVLPVAHGGTGASTLTSGAALIGNGTGAVTTRNITNNTSNSSGIAGSTNLLTMNTLKNALNRATGLAAADTGYTTYMARGIALVTAAPSSMKNGTVAFVYE